MSRSVVQSSVRPFALVRPRCGRLPSSNCTSDRQSNVRSDGRRGRSVGRSVLTREAWIKQNLICPAKRAVEWQPTCRFRTVFRLILNVQFGFNRGGPERWANERSFTNSIAGVL